MMIKQLCALIDWLIMFNNMPHPATHATLVCSASTPTKQPKDSVTRFNVDSFKKYCFWHFWKLFDSFEGKDKYSTVT